MNSQKLRAAAPTIAEHAIPARKLSETLLEFGAPLLAQLGEDAPLPVRQQCLQLVIMVWNAGALAMPQWGKRELLDETEQALKQLPLSSVVNELLQQLQTSRREYFGSDPRAVGDWELRPAPDGSYVLHCMAHLPSGEVGVAKGSRGT